MQATSTAITSDRLNNLVEAARDGEQGFRAAAEDCSDPALKEKLSLFARERSEIIRQLQSIVRSAGQTPEQEGSVAGAMHRGWITLKSKLSQRDELSILEECERGETYALEQFDEALASSELDKYHNVVQRHRDAVHETREEVRALKSRFERSGALA